MNEATPRRPAYARLLDRAIRILASRDHSEQELRRKLVAPVMTKNGPEAIEYTEEDLERVIAWCFESNYLDDNRFAERLIASQSRKGYGPARIRQTLSQKGISRPVAEQLMRECEIDWIAAAHEQAERKYGAPLPTEFAAKVKVQRFLMYRGYLMEDIQAVFVK